MQPAAKPRDDVDQKLEHVSFTFDTIELGSLIVCGLPALPHDLVHKSDARRRLLRVPRYTANQCVAATIPEVHRLHAANNGSPFFRLKLKMYVTFATTVRWHPCELQCRGFENAQSARARGFVVLERGGAPVRSCR